MKKIFSILILLTGILFSSVAYAAPAQIILFCSSWNLKCREARKTCSAAAQDLGICFTDLDIDQAYSQQKANDLKLIFPSAIPYIYVLDKKGHVIKGKIYQGETSQDLEQEIKEY
jgi:hypothetical protein